MKQILERTQQPLHLPDLPTIKLGHRYDTSHPEAAQALAAVEQLAAEIAAGWPPRWLSLLGKPGVGKTMLATRLAAWARPRQEMCVMWGWSRVCDFLASGDWAILAQLRTQPVLILDDITQIYEWPLSAFDNKTFRALGSLLNERVNRWTVITDNRLRYELAQKDARIASRIKRHGSAIVEFTNCPDFWANARHQ